MPSAASEEKCALCNGPIQGRVIVREGKRYCSLTCANEVTKPDSRRPVVNGWKIKKPAEAK